MPASILPAGQSGHSGARHSRGRRLNHQHPSNHRREMHLCAAPGPRPLGARHVTALDAPHASPSQSASCEPGISCEPSLGPTRERQSRCLPASPAAVTDPIYAPDAAYFSSFMSHLSRVMFRIAEPGGPITQSSPS